MMSPANERQVLLGNAIREATLALGDPIDRIEVGRDHVYAWAGKRLAKMRYGYADSYDAHGNPLLGGGRWTVEIEEVR
jgi:hypothetical protein